MIRVLYTGGELRMRRRETILNHPPGIEYVTTVDVNKMRPDYLVSKTPSRKLNFRDLTRGLIYALHIPNIRYVASKFTRQVDVIHTPGQMLLNRSPYIIEVENVGALGFYNMTTVRRRIGLIKRFLKGKYCRRLMCLSEASRKSVINTFRDPDIRKKITVIYPYVALNKYRKTRRDNKVVILTSNTKFFMKGTPAVLEAFTILARKYLNIELWVVSNAPAEYISKFDLRSKRHVERIKFFEAKFLKQEMYKRFYANCDIFVQASYQDSLGLTYLEIAASGKPIIATDVFATAEVVEHGKNGFLIKSPFHNHNPNFTLKPEFFPMPVRNTEREFYARIDDRSVVRQLCAYLPKLIENRALRERMGRHSLELIKTRFAESKRQRELKEMYESALRA